MMGFAIFVAGITTCRMSIGLQNYLRVHRPLATVLWSQIVVLFLVLVQFADFSGRV